MAETYTVGPIPLTYAELSALVETLSEEVRMLRLHALTTGAYLKQMGESLERMGPVEKPVESPCQDLPVRI